MHPAVPTHAKSSRANVGESTFTAICEPAIELKIQACAGVQVEPTHAQCNRRSEPDVIGTLRLHLSAQTLHAWQAARLAKTGR